MQFTCPGCSKTAEVDDKFLGRTVRCPKCKTKSKIRQTPPKHSEIEAATDAFYDDEWPDAMESDADPDYGLPGNKRNPPEIPEAFPVTDATRTTTKSGTTRRDFSCPNCEASLKSTEEEFDTCPRCAVELRFVDEINSLSDARTRVASVSHGSLFSPLRQWLIVVVGVHLLVGLLMGTTIQDAITTDKSGLSQLLVFCYVAALIRSFIDVRHIDIQTGLARRQVLTLTKGGRIKRLLETCDDSMLRDHITNLYEISKRSEEVSQDNLVVLMQSKLHARIRLTEIAGSILVTIGLIGTVMGLIASFGGIDAVLKNVGDDRQKMLSGFAETLSGMGTAFYTTLLGSILGGVVMRVLNAIVVSGTDSLLSRIAELTEVYILPTLRSTAKNRRLK